jgi:hypothetical protein
MVDANIIIKEKLSKVVCKNRCETVSAFMTVVDTRNPIVIKLPENKDNKRKISFVLWHYFENPSDLIREKTNLMVDYSDNKTKPYERDLRFFNLINPYQYLKTIDKKANLLATNVFCKFTNIIKLKHSENIGKALMIVITDEIYSTLPNSLDNWMGDPAIYCKELYDVLENEKVDVDDMVKIFNNFFHEKNLVFSVKITN